MKQVYFNKLIIISVLFTALIASLSWYSIEKAQIVAEKANTACKIAPLGSEGHMIWDQVTRGFISFLAI